MKSKIKNVILTLSIFFLFQSCYKDKGEYNIIDYNKIGAISSLSGRAVILGDTLKIKTIVKWKYPTQDTLGFKYEWKQQDLTISHERDLKYIPKTAGRFMFYLYVTENATQIVSRFVMQITINSPYKGGWVILSDRSGKSALSYIRRNTFTDANGKPNYSYTLHPDVYANLNPTDPLGSNPKRLFSTIFSGYDADEILVIQGNNESVFLNGADFSKKVYLKNEFNGRSFPKGAQPVAYHDGGPLNYVLFDNGEVYWKRNTIDIGGVHDGMYMTVPLYFEGGDAKVSQFIKNDFDKSEFIYMYDELNKRFLGVYSSTNLNDFLGSKLRLVNATNPPLGFADLSNLINYKLIYSSDYSNGIYFMNILKSNQTGEYIYQTYRTAMRFTSIEVTEHQQEVFAGNGLVSDHTIYYRIRNGSYLFMGEGSKLYFYDVNTKKIKLYHDFGSGRIISICTDADSGELGVALDNGSFYICSLKNEILGANHPGAEGGILYEAKDLGKIVDITWKWGGFFDFGARRYPGL